MRPKGLKGETMVYGLLGEHLSHSYSPLIHSMLGDYEYRLFEKSPDELCDFLKNGDFKAINVTIPYKKAVIPYLSDLSENAKAAGSVNVIIRREDGSLFGDNSDIGGFYSLIRKSKIPVKSKKVLVLGSGGASNTAVFVLSRLGAREIVVISRSGENNYTNIHRHSDADVIINTTPVGMYPNNGKSPVDLSVFKRLSGVIDVIYNPFETALILDAKERGIKAIGGLNMLVAQAAIANEMFFSRKLDRSVINNAEKQVALSMKNIVLIGMPGCGKSTTGKRLAALTGRRFIDIDAEIEKRTGRTIPEIFREEGEDAFRKLETEVTAEVCRESGCVISTGGGVVTREENRRHIRQNSVVIFLSRSLDKLATRGRPLSETNFADALWAVRGPRYKEWSDIQMLNTGINYTSRSIMRTLNLRRKENNQNEK